MNPQDEPLFQPRAQAEHAAIFQTPEENITPTGTTSHRITIHIQTLRVRRYHDDHYSNTHIQTMLRYTLLRIQHGTMSPNAEGTTTC